MIKRKECSWYAFRLKIINDDFICPKFCAGSNKSNLT